MGHQTKAFARYDSNSRQLNVGNTCNSTSSGNAEPICSMHNFLASLLADVVSMEPLNETFSKSTVNKVVREITVKKDNRKETSASNQITEESFN